MMKNISLLAILALFIFSFIPVKSSAQVDFKASNGGPIQLTDETPTRHYWKQINTDKNDSRVSDYIYVKEFYTENKSDEFKWKLKLEFDADLCDDLKDIKTTQGYMDKSIEYFDTEDRWLDLSMMDAFPVVTPYDTDFLDMTDCENEIEIELPFKEWRDGIQLKLGFGSQVWQTSTECMFNSTKCPSGSCYYEDEIIYANCDVYIDGVNLFFSNVSMTVNQTASTSHNIDVFANGGFFVNESTMFYSNNSYWYYIYNRGQMNITDGSNCNQSNIARIYTYQDSVSLFDGMDKGLGDTTDRTECYFYIRGNSDVIFNNMSIQTIDFINDQAGRNMTVNGVRYADTFSKDNAVTTDGGMDVSFTDSFMVEVEYFFFEGKNNLIESSTLYRYQTDDAEGITLHVNNTNAGSSYTFLYSLNNVNEQLRVYFSNSTESYMYFISVGTEAKAFTDCDNRDNTYCTLTNVLIRGGRWNITGYWHITVDEVSYFYDHATLDFRRTYPITFFSDAGLTNVGAGYTVTIVNESGTVCDTQTTDANGRVNLTTCAEPHQASGGSKPLSSLAQYNITFDGGVVASNITVLNSTHHADASGNIVGLRFDNVVVDTTPPDVNFDANMPANLSYTDNEDYIFYMVNGSESLGGGLLECNGTNHTMSVSGNDATLNRTGLINMTTYACFAWANDTAGNLNRTINELWYTINLTTPVCTPNFTNTSWSAWYNVTACNVSNQTLQERYLIEYDANNCAGSSNTTYYEYQVINCTYSEAETIDRSTFMVLRFTGLPWLAESIIPKVINTVAVYIGELNAGSINVINLRGNYINGEAYVCVYNNGTIYAKETGCN